MRSGSQVSLQFRGLEGNHSSSSIQKWWDTHVKSLLFGVIYTMAKENVLPKGFDIANAIIEFFQMATFCFRSEFHWSGIHFGNITIGFIGYDLFRIGFWICFAFLVLTAMNVSYIAYSFNKGEVRSIFLLKTLRWICSLFVTVLFIPIVYILLAGLACDYSTSPATLFSFPEVECWGREHFPIGIVSPFLVVIFTVFSLFTGLTFYEYDPNMTHACCGIQNRFKFVALWLKMLVVFVTLFLQSYSTVFAVISFFSVMALLSSYVTLLPAYDNRINMIRCGSLTGVVWVNVCMMVAIGIGNSSNYASVVLLGVGLPFAIALGCFIAVRRLRYVCNPQLVDGFVTAEVPLPPAVRVPTKKSITWDKPQVNKLLRNKLFSHLTFPVDVEIAARFALSKKPNPILIEKAKTVYQTGLGKFPKSPTVLQAYANFLFTVVGDWQMGYLALEKLRLMKPAIDIQFFIYRYDKDREHKTEGGHGSTGNFIEFMEFKKLHQAAKRFHQGALTSIRKFWRALLESKVDVLRLADLSSKIAMTEKKAAEHYIRLLELYPKNVKILRDYARFLDEIVRDSKSANELWKKADKYEERQMAKNTDSHRSQQGAGGEPREDDSPRENEEEMSEIRSEHTSETSFDDAVTATTDSSAALGSGLAAARLEKNAKLKKLSWIMFFTTLFVLVVTFTQLGTLNPELNKFKSLMSTLDGAGGSSHAAVDSVIIALDGLVVGTVALQMNYTEFGLPWTGTYANLMGQLLAMSNLFGNDAKSLYWGASNSEPFTSMRRLRLKRQAGMHLALDPTLSVMSYSEFNHHMADLAEIQSIFNDPIYNQTMWAGGFVPGQFDFVTSMANLWGLAISAANYMNRLAAAPLISLNGLSAGLFSSWYEAISYAGFNLWHISNGAQRIINLCQTNVQQQLQVLILASAVIFTIAVVALILAAGFLFFPVVRGIYQYKIKTLYMFTLIPSSVVRHIIKKRPTQLGQDSSSGDEEDEEELDIILEKEKIIRTPRGGTQSSKKTLLADGEEGDEGDGEEEEGEEEGGDTPVSPVSPEALDEMLAAQAHISMHPGPLAQLQKPERTPLPYRVSAPTPLNVPSSPHMDLASPNSAPARTTSITPAPPMTPRNPPDDSHAVDIPSGSQPEGHFHFLRGLSIKLPSVEQQPKKPKNYKKLASDEQDDPLQLQNGSSQKKRRANDHSRIDLRSLTAVGRRIHLQYIVPIIFLFIGLAVTFATTYSFLIQLKTLSHTLTLSDSRTLYAHLVVYDLSVMYMAQDYPVVDIAADRLADDLNQFWEFHLSTPVKNSEKQQNFMYGHECLRINQSTCTNETYPYYDDVSYGLNNLLLTFYTLSKSLLLSWNPNTTASENLYNPDFIKLRILTENEVFDGLEIMTFDNYESALNQINNARTQLALVSSIEAICFILIHIIFFRPFVRRLHEESDNTHSILRMIPRKLVQHIPEIQEFFEDTGIQT